MPRVARLYIVSMIVGFTISAVFVSLVMVFNVANLGHLILTSDIALTATAAFWVLNGIVFSAVQFGYAVMQLAEED